MMRLTIVPGKGLIKIFGVSLGGMAMPKYGERQVMAYSFIFMLGILFMLPFNCSALAWEINSDRPGSDLFSFDPMFSLSACPRACQRDARCVAWTFVNAGVQAPQARCWIKNSVPPRQANTCCISGLKEPLESNVDRPGSDYLNYALTLPDPYDCQLACQGDTRCRAWTYVNPGVQGPGARCWFKNGIPDQQPNNCCVSGIKIGP